MNSAASARAGATSMLERLSKRPKAAALAAAALVISLQPLYYWMILAFANKKEFVLYTIYWPWRISIAPGMCAARTLSLHGSKALYAAITLFSGVVWGGLTFGFLSLLQRRRGPAPKAL